MQRSDTVILDLEGRGRPAAKAEARSAVAAALPGLGGNVLVRVNATGTPWFADIAMRWAPHVAIIDGLTRESAEAADLGFAATACIHPSHLPVIRGAFRPSAEMIARVDR